MENPSIFTIVAFLKGAENPLCHQYKCAIDKIRSNNDRNQLRLLDKITLLPYQAQIYKGLVITPY